MDTTKPKSPTILLIPLLMLAFGILLMVFMIVVEDEPGAIPTLLIVVGTAWAFIIKRKTSRLSRGN
ncbi:hypothetical protein [Balneola vulgaris]|jgi:c-di-AMP phosphodiesterase-like protein|uniref:hypothetical protein n=1 Tax=Balneola vulgaris TaxID=287535 RepID=UPI00036E71D8|nr:hypothetical protein [Balneola vulgaris]